MAVVSASTEATAKFPPGAAGLDSWADVYLQYVNQPGDQWTESLQLADGTSTSCRTETGVKGIPKAFLVKSDLREQIDLLPLSWLLDRWCSVDWGNNNTFTTAAGRPLQVHWWSGFPYLTSEQIKVVIEDLPEADVKGRSGLSVGRPITAAAVKFNLRACAAR